MASYEARTRRFTRAEYERLIDLGVFQPGESLTKAIPQGMAATQEIAEYLRRRLRRRTEP